MLSTYMMSVENSDFNDFVMHKNIHQRVGVQSTLFWQLNENLDLMVVEKED